MKKFFTTDRIEPKGWLIFHLILFLGIAGCATQTVVPSEQTVLTRDLQPPAGKALVYFYYEKISMKPTEVSLDGVKSIIKKDKYALWEVAPGKYQLEFTFSLGMLSEVVTTEITCEPNQNYYFHRWNIGL